jgi:hypothetical protein
LLQSRMLLFYGSSRVDLAGSSLYIWDNRHGYISNREIRRGREGRRGETDHRAWRSCWRQ